MIDATAIIMTKNEEKNIGDCLKSMQGFAKRCVVIDCGSTDKTVEIAKQYGADVYFHEFEYYARQFNWGIDNCDIDTEWIIRLDADERFPETLNKEIEKLIEDNKEKPMNGITIEADLYYLGRVMKHGLRNKRKMMMFKKAYGRIEDRKRDAHSVISEGFSVSTKHRFVHYDFKSIDKYIKKYNWYATREVQDYIDFVHGAETNINTDPAILAQRKKKFGLYYKAPKFFRCWAWFIYNYVFRGGFLDGKEGLVFCFLECYWYRFVVDSKIYEYEHCGGEMEKLKALD